MTIAHRPFLSLPTTCPADPLSFGIEADSWQAPGIWTAPLLLAAHDDSEPPAPLSSRRLRRARPSPPRSRPSRPAGPPPPPAASTSPSTSTTKACKSPDRHRPVDDPPRRDHPARGVLGQPLPGRRPQRLHRSRPRPRDGQIRTGAGLPPGRQDRLGRSRKPADRRKGQRRPLHRQALREPLRLAAGDVSGAEEPDPRDLGRPAPEDRIRPADRPADHHRHRHPPAALLPLPPALPRGHPPPLATPPACGKYDVKAELTPWSGGLPITTSSTFEIISGPDNSPCPSGGLPPFHPALTAGTLNNAAGAYSPFNVKLTRTDSEQEFTHFSIKLPPGVAGKLAGIPFCSDAAIAAATARTGPHGGQEELNAPSCPAASYVGRTLAGAGVGPASPTPPARSTSPAPTTASHSPWSRSPPASSAPSTSAPSSSASRSTSTPKPAKSSSTPPAPTPCPTSSRASPSTCATSAPIPIGPNSPSTRPAANRPAPPRPCSARASTSSARPTTTRSSRPAASRPPTAPASPSSRSSSLRLKGATKRGGNPALRAVLAPKARRCQLEEHLGRPAALGVPRPGPHPHRLHPGPVQRRCRQRRRLPGGIDLRPRPRLDPDPLRTAGRHRSSCAAPNTRCPTWWWRCTG